MTGVGRGTGEGTGEAMVGVGRSAGEVAVVGERQPGVRRVGRSLGGLRCGAPGAVAVSAK
ncbi:hypothetical protein DKG71_18220 [Streptomyces sp. NEAU-S7GS2]|nr:hypothetical protein DKG71_18220 [Streptomyces sp. NEAU-S7GS2]